MELHEYSKEELEQEIKRRETNALELPVKDFSEVISLVKGHVKTVLSNGSYDDDDLHYIFEAAVETVYGKNIWESYNKALK